MGLEEYVIQCIYLYLVIIKRLSINVQYMDEYILSNIISSNEQLKVYFLLI